MNIFRRLPTKSGSHKENGENVSHIGLDFFKEDKDAQKELKRRTKSK